MKEKTRVYISICSKDRPWWPSVVSTQIAVQMATQSGISCWIYPHIGESMICRARMDALAAFMQSDCEWYLTLDDDLKIPPHTITRLVSNQLPIVCGFYRLKSDTFHWAQRLVKVGDQLPSDYTGMFKNGEVKEIYYGSTGCMLVHRDVICTLQDKHPELLYEQNITKRSQYALYLPFLHENELLSEDWAFCERAKRAGYTIYGDGSVICDHYGSTVFTTSIKGEDNVNLEEDSR